MAHGIDRILNERESHPRDGSRDPATDQRRFPSAQSNRDDFDPERGEDQTPTREMGPATAFDASEASRERRSSRKPDPGDKVDVTADLDTASKLSSLIGLGGLL